MLRGGSRSFFAAALLLPRRVRRAGDRALRLLPRGRRRDRRGDGGARALAGCTTGSTAIYAGRPLPQPGRPRAWPPWSRAHAMPRALLEALLEGFAWDAEGRRYEDLAGAARLRRAGRRHGRRDDGGADGRARARRRWRAPATSASPCSSPTSPATSARMRAPAGSICRWPGCARRASTPTRGWPRPALHARHWPRVVARLLAEADALYVRGRCGHRRLPLRLPPGHRRRAPALCRDRPRGGAATGMTASRAGARVVPAGASSRLRRRAAWLAAPLPARRLRCRAAARWPRRAAWPPRPPRCAPTRRGASSSDRVRLAASTCSPTSTQRQTEPDG